MGKVGTEKIIESMVNLLRDNYKPEKVILFGSYAWGLPTEESDIDLLVIKDTKSAFFKRLLEVRQIVSLARKGYAFEPIVLTPQELKDRTEKKDPFFAEILTRGKVLYDAA